jgi:DNA-binding transcriptional ArsR family regulator
MVVASIASAIGEPARARMLYCLVDGRARTSTELATLAEVSPSTASAHLTRLKDERLIKLQVQGKHRYYSLAGPNVARALEGLSVLAGAPRTEFVPNTPSTLLAARTCYDHIAGRLGVALHDRLQALRWIVAKPGENGDGDSIGVTAQGVRAFVDLGVNLEETQSRRRRFAYACVDWSERRPHVGGALGAALLHLALKRRWVARELDSRALEVTGAGRREMRSRFGLEI